MTPDEIRAEVERRKQRARELKIRETLWHLETSFRSYRHWLREEPQFGVRMVYPRIELSKNEARFSIGQATYQLAYSEGRVSSEDYGDRFEVTYGTLALKLNGESVFEFELTETTQYGHDSPLFSDSLGETTRFIEGPWFTELSCIRLGS
jgi:hypothetical protein